MKRLPEILLGFGLLIGTILLIWQAILVPQISHDDAISYMAATSHETSYNGGKLPIAGQWVPAREWQSFWANDHTSSFSKIGENLAKTDMHPPLYFWILYIWLDYNGIELSTGPVLNVLFNLGTCLGIFLICTFLKCSRLIGTLTALTWLFCFANFQVAAETRQYSLLALETTLFIYYLLKFLNTPKIRTAIYLGISVLLGITTHYHFFLLLTAFLSIVFFILYKKRETKTFKFLSLSIASSLLAFILIHPLFFKSFVFLGKNFKSEQFNFNEMILRSSKAMITFLEFLVPFISLVDIRNSTNSVILGISGMICMVLVIKFLFKNMFNSSVKVFDIKVLPLKGCFFLLVILYTLYISFFTPEHAMKSKYLMLVSPLVFIVLAQFINKIRNKNYSVALLVFCLVYQATYTGIAFSNFRNSSFRTKDMLARNSRTSMLIDSLQRGVVASALWHVEPEVMVFADTNLNIINNFSSVTQENRILYVSGFSDDENIERDLILATFSKNNYTIMPRRRLVGRLQTYLLSKNKSK